jgi:hypothetical protein
LQHKIQELLKEGWLKLSEERKDEFREWTDWDKKRYARDLEIYEKSKAEEQQDDDTNIVVDNDDIKTIHIPKKRKQSREEDNCNIPRKKKI